MEFYILMFFVFVIIIAGGVLSLIELDIRTYEKIINKKE